MNKIYLDLLDLKTKKTFRKYFETKKAKNDFLLKLKYSNKLMVLGMQKLYY
jgi:hypothetical protein